MSDPIGDYIAANAAYKAAVANLAPIIQVVLRVTHTLEHRPEDFRFVDLALTKPFGPLMYAWRERTSG
jgi:hypothetical protein